jgi:hypothetical protein
MKPPDTLYAARDHAVAFEDGVFYLVLRARPDESVLRRVRLELERLEPGKVLGYFQLMAPRPGSGAPPGGPPTRAWLELTEAARQRARAGAVVVTTEGFAAATLRAAITGVLLATRTRKPTRVFGGIAEAATWMGGELASQPHAPNAGAIEAVAEALLAGLVAED